MEFFGDGVYRLTGHALSAWNVDGSSSDAYEDISWIRLWEEKAGLVRSACSYSGCQRSADVGGHIWIAQRGVFVAPICASCNYAFNANRMQGAQSTLREDAVVVQTEYTEDMANSDRRKAVVRRECEGCNEDISDCPASYTLCAQCYHEENQREIQARRCCEDCGVNIGDRPEHHTQCLQCYRQQQNRRGCENCGKDIQDRPEHHTQCLQCYRQQQSRRGCEDCGKDIQDRPEHHTQCLQCYRGGRGQMRSRRWCEDCYDDITDRPEYHTQCMSCYRQDGQNYKRQRRW